MASTLADDLLKSRSIHELRELVHTLQTDADAKKSELQSMVGSQYHEFIQSADRIATMQTQSHNILAMLEQLGSSTQEALRNVKFMIAGKMESIELSPKSGVDKLSIVADMRCSDVWRDLNQLDVYSAALKILSADILLDSHQASSPAGGNAAKQAFLLPNVSSTIRARALPDSSRRELRSISFLAETVVQDAKLICLADTPLECDISTVLAKARAMAAYRLLASKDQSEALRLCTQCIDLDVKEILKRELSPSSAHTDHETGLEALVKKLQHAIVDLYLLFCKPFSIAQGAVVHGLVHYFMVQLMVQVNNQFVDPIVDSNHPPEAILRAVEDSDHPSTREVAKDIKEYLHKTFAYITDQCQLVLQSISNALQVATLQHVIYHASTNMLYRRSGMTGLVSPPALPSKVTVGSFVLEYGQEIFMEASYELLSSKVVKHKRVISEAVGQTVHSNAIQHDAHSLLWNKVFYILFLNIVETLLCKACEDIWIQAVHLLADILRGMGLQVSLQTHTAATSSGSRSALGSTKATLLVESLTATGSVEALSSAQIYTKAEYLSSFVDHAVAKLLEDVIKPVHRSAEDADSPTALSLSSLNKALRLYCSKLCGQLLCTLRMVAQHLQAVLHSISFSQGALLSEAHAKGKLLRAKLKACERPELEAQAAAYREHFRSRAASQPNHPNPQQCAQLVANGLLLMGRLAWTMKHRCNALFTALQSSETPAPPSKSTAAAGNFISLEQLKSAFEIADTNGDGVLERDEALEALQALSLSDSEAFSASAAGSVLNRIATLSFPEFLLVFGTDCTENDSRQRETLVQGMHDCLDYLVAFTHTVFAVLAVQRAVADASLQSHLLRELGVQDGQPSRAAFHKFKSTWISQNMDDESTEQISIPSQCSAALYALLFPLLREINLRMVSIDSMQTYPSPSPASSPSPPEEDDDLNPMQLLGNLFLGHPASRSLVLVDLFHRLLHGLLLEQLQLQYQAVLDTVLPCIRGQQQRLGGTCWGDEVLLQLLLDLHVCQHLCERSGVSAADLQSLRRVAQNLVDPVLAELVAQPLDTMQRNVVQRMHLLLFPYSPACALASSARVAISTNVSPANVVPSVFASVKGVARFGLLPLAMVTSTASKTSGEVSRRDGDGISRRDGAMSSSRASSSSPATVGSGGTSQSKSGGGIMGWFSSK